ncbi:MAG: DUF5678 domain-containing protein [Blastocatellia bacterium]
MTTLKQMIEAASALPPEDRRRLRQWLQEQERQDAIQRQPAETVSPRSAETVEEQVARFRKAQQWIKEHRAEYLGQWVVLVGDQLISHGFDGHQVCDEAKAAGIEIPFLVQVVEEPEAYCGGWL